MLLQLLLILFALGTAFVKPAHFLGASAKAPKALQDVPDGWKSGIVLNQKVLAVPGAEFCYNPAYIPDSSGNTGLLFLRVDGNRLAYPEGKKLRESHISCIKIDRDLEYNSKILRIDTKNAFAEDPRAISLQGQNLIIFNENSNLQKYDRNMSLLKIDRSCRPISKVKLEYGIQKIEKNWAPIVSNNQLFFIYSFIPFTVISYKEKCPPNIQLVTSENAKEALVEWKKKWGEPRGGTPAVIIDGHQLLFFHSSFVHRQNGMKRRWFTFGALLLEKDPPFNPVAISKFPIFSESFYSCLRSSTAPKRKCVIYPSGIDVFDDAKLGKVIRLFCGMNDSKVAAIDLSYRALFENMQQI